MKILDLPLKARWYDMIESGEKKEEYREIKPYWVKRLVPCTHGCANGHWSDKYFRCVFDCKAVYTHMNRHPRYTHVRFRYGYTKRTMLLELKEITIGRGNPDWGAPDYDVFIIKLGKKEAEK